MAGEGSNRGWKERGVGTFKFNITADEPKKARFVLRAEGTHRLLLNAAVTRKMVFGGDAQGEKPKDGRLLFNSPNMEGELEMHLLRVGISALHNMFNLVLTTFTDEGGKRKTALGGSHKGARGTVVGSFSPRPRHLSPGKALRVE